MSKITITDLEVYYRVGVPDEERANPQRLLITVDLTFDFSSAATSDRITKTIDYFDVSQKVIAFGQDRTWKLIEKTAADVADFVLSEYKPAAVTVIVKKFPIPQAAHVSVTLTKHRAGSGSVKRVGWGSP
jgi:FolB domain-containing protein